MIFPVLLPLVPRESIPRVTSLAGTEMRPHFMAFCARREIRDDLQEEIQMQRHVRHYLLVLGLALIGPLISCGGGSSPNVVLAQSTARTMTGLAGTWQATLIGNTGCGLTSYLVTFTLNSSGAATNAAITGHYLNGGNSVCVDGATSTALSTSWH